MHTIKLNRNRLAIMPLVFLLLTSFVYAEESATLSSAESLELVGDDLSGWVAEGKTRFEKDGKETPVWTVEDGTIRCAGSGFGFLRYDRKFDDFELQLEYKYSPGCNSGIGIRTVPFTGARKTRPSKAGYELQILDEERVNTSEYKKPRLSMSFYGHVERPKNHQRPPGEWNEVVIRCMGPRIRVTLNGESVHDLDQREVQSMKKKPLSGYVCLQNHGHAIDFRNVRVTPLLKQEKEASE